MVNNQMVTKTMITTKENNYVSLSHYIIHNKLNTSTITTALVNINTLRKLIRCELYHFIQGLPNSPSKNEHTLRTLVSNMEQDILNVLLQLIVISSTGIRSYNSNGEDAETSLIDQQVQEIILTLEMNDLWINVDVTKDAFTQRTLRILNIVATTQEFLMTQLKTTLMEQWNKLFIVKDFVYLSMDNVLLICGD